MSVSGCLLSHKVILWNLPTASLATKTCYGTGGLQSTSLMFIITTAYYKHWYQGLLLNNMSSWLIMKFAYYIPRHQVILWRMRTTPSSYLMTIAYYILRQQSILYMLHIMTSRHITASDTYTPPFEWIIYLFGYCYKKTRCK